ncbi:helix-turn-helix transcriptional regulator [Longispora sp. NPDC051575]|uniref:helix-turn-helix transcriptional regulator n=1 Tax=Longispora sp. NPDC051575 TaxID=3154943 RepID=UPI00342EA64B
MASELEERVNALYGHIGRKVREARKRARLTQDDLAQAVGMTRSSIANLEAGRQRIPVHLLVLIGELLNMRASDLLPNGPTFNGMLLMTDVTEHLVNDQAGMQDFVQSTIAKASMAAPKRGS